MRSNGSALSHTYFPVAFAEVILNGVVAGEAGINCLVAQAHGVPIVLVTGDAITAAETRRFCPDIHTAVVKESISRLAADSLQ
jgi:D-amino peptidase